MDPFTKFKQALDSYGLEAFGKYYGHYKGFVFSNKDPEFRARLLIEVPQIYGMEVPEIWALSKGMFTGKGVGFYALPAKNDPVWITFENGDPQYPIWEYGWISDGDLPEKAKIEGNTNFVFQSGGNRLEFNEQDNKVTISNKAGFQIQLDESGVHVGKDMEGESLSLEEFILDFLQGIIEAKTATQLGAQPLINVATFTELKQKLLNLQSKKMTIIK